jgi:quinol monooxygenase YgiN
VYARVATWRAKPGDFDALSREIAPIIAQLRQQEGYVAGYGIRLAPDTQMFVSIWDSEAQMRTAFNSSMAGIRPLIDSGRLTLVELKTGPAQEWQ